MKFFEMLASFFRLLVRCYRMAVPYSRIRLLGVLGLILLNGVVQLVGVTSVFPFFALAADTDRIRHSAFGGSLLSCLPALDNQHLLVVAGCFAIAMLAVAGVVSIASEYLRIRYAYGFCHWLRCRLFEAYASQPYAFFLRRNSAELSQRLLDVQSFINNVLLPVGEILTRLIMVLLLIGGVFLIQPWVALGAGGLFGGFYLLVFLWLRPRARLVGEGMQRHNLGFAKNTTQFIHGIKTVLVHGKSRFFIDKALEHSSRLGQYQSQIPICGTGPRYLIEPIAFGGLVAIVVVMALRGQPFADILPKLSVLALAGYRLLPALQMLYSQLVSVAASNYTLQQLEEELQGLRGKAANPPPPATPAGLNEVATTQWITFRRELRLEHITFQYPGTLAPVLENFNLVIAKNESVGIAGPSGSGKSTLVDLILGLHRPQSGMIRMDDALLTDENLHKWRRMIGYVPQEIYLLDDTIEANIAFGVEPRDVDAAALRAAALGAQILEFIEKELPQGFQSRVGERGVRLSGGQRQRIGLARALYHRPQVLVLDEATSALDHQTELAVMETIHKLQGTLTIITIAHRLSTLERCDRIVRLEKRSRLPAATETTGSAGQPGPLKPSGKGATTAPLPGDALPGDAALILRFNPNHSMRRILRRIWPVWMSQPTYGIRFLIQRPIARARRRRAPRRFLIIPADLATLIGSRGDEAMMKALRDHLRANYGDIQISVMSECAQEELVFFGFERIRAQGAIPFDWKTRSAVLAFDAVFVIGADVLDGGYSVDWSLDMWSLAYRIAADGCPVTIAGFSMNENVAAVIWDKIARFPKGVRINLRDPVSKRRFDAHCPGLAKLTADMAFALKPAPPTAIPPRTERWIQERKLAGDLVVGFNINRHLIKDIPTLTVTKLVDGTVAVLSRLAQTRKISFLLIPHDVREASNDTALLAELEDRLLPELGELVHLAEGFHADGIKSLVGRMDAVITGRMHLAIAALGQGVPTLGINYNGKFEGLMEHFELPAWLVTTPRELCDDEGFVEVVNRFLAIRADLSSRIKARLPEITALAERNFLLPEWR